MVDDYWDGTKRCLRTALSANDFATWIEPLHAATWCDGVLTLQVPNAFFRDWVRRHYQALIEHAASQVGGTPMQAVLEIDRTLEVEPVRGEEATDAVATGAVVRDAAPVTRSGRHTFESFVVGKSNALAFDAARAIVERPGQRFSPLFIHGGVGLGKTHLIGAIANDLRGRGRRGVSLVTAEMFVNDMIAAIRRSQMERFRERYRRTGTLIVDDIQFLEGKARSQEEFANTFNALHEACRQIVLVSDRPPTAMPGIDEALRTRFASGLCVAIDVPDATLRLALVTRKAADLGLAIERDVAQFLATRCADNVRSLEGALAKLYLITGMAERPITMGVLREAFGDAVAVPAEESSIDAILDAVCLQYGLTRDDLTSRRRTARLVRPRQVAMLLCRRYTQARLDEIGASLGGRDHSTVVYSLSTIERHLREDAALRAVVDGLARRLNG